MHVFLLVCTVVCFSFQPLRAGWPGILNQVGPFVATCILEVSEGRKRKRQEPKQLYILSGVVKYDAPGLDTHSTVLLLLILYCCSFFFFFRKDGMILESKGDCWRFLKLCFSIVKEKKKQRQYFESTCVLVRFLQ